MRNQRQQTYTFAPTYRIGHIETQATGTHLAARR
jgi:hypothetical protein